MVRGRRHLMWECTSAVLAKLHNAWCGGAKKAEDFNLPLAEERGACRMATVEDLERMERELAAASGPAAPKPQPATR